MEREGNVHRVRPPISSGTQSWVVRMSKLRDKMLRGEKPTGSVDDLAEFLIEEIRAMSPEQKAQLRKECYEESTGKKYEEGG